MEIVALFCSCFLFVSCSHGQQQQRAWTQRAWTQRDCQEMAGACNPLPKGAKGSLGGEGPPGRSGPSGSPGRPGPPGPRGFSRSSRPGPSGAPATRGELGNLGYSGLRGEPGQVGPKGLKGREGYSGFPGNQGQEGQQGSRGSTGDRGPPGESMSAWTKCTWAMDSEQDDGLLKECKFTKKKALTSVHVIYEGSLQIGLCRRCCKRWYFTFNDAECTRPSVIDAIMSGGFRNDFPHHSYGRIEGLCEVPFPPGRVRIALHLENCRGIPGSLEPVNINVYNPEGRILIREVSPSQ